MKSIILFDSLEEAKNMISHRETKRVQLEGNTYALTRFNDDFYFYEAFCPHQDYSLLQDKIGLRPEVICGWHGYRFSLVGGEEFEKRCRNLNVQQLKTNEHSELYIDL
ncbi:MAG: Rieske (2Fe-2S) protein [Cyclobacteriaceae bacterium]